MIQDAILEKCIENGASVVHIAVDKSSSEVSTPTVKQKVLHEDFTLGVKGKNGNHLPREMILGD